MNKMTHAIVMCFYELSPTICGIYHFETFLKIDLHIYRGDESLERTEICLKCVIEILLFIYVSKNRLSCIEFLNKNKMIRGVIS